MPSSTYAESFGFEWTTFPRLQLDDANRRESEETFRLKTGLEPGDVEGRTVLDAGCGMGRFSDVVARWGAQRVVGVDLSQSVEPAAMNLGAYDSVAVLQADLRALPLEPASFDIVFSIGVLHHTPNTLESLTRLAQFVKPGGRLCVWVYSKRLRLTHAGSEVLRLYTRRIDHQRLLRLVRRAVPRVHSLRTRLPALRRLFDMVVPVSSHPDPMWRILDTFDWYSPRYQWKHTYREVEGWFRELGFIDVGRQPVPVAVAGRRPPLA